MTTQGSKMKTRRTEPRPHDEINSLSLLLHEIDQLNVGEGARAQFLGLLHRMAGHTIRLNRCILTRPQKLRLALRLLDGGMTVAQARAALVERTGVSSRSAYRLIGVALNQRLEGRRAGGPLAAPDVGDAQGSAVGDADHG